jgi:hypothetical protein
MQQMLYVVFIVQCMIICKPPLYTKSTNERASNNKEKNKEKHTLATARICVTQINSPNNRGWEINKESAPRRRG